MFLDTPRAEVYDAVCRRDCAIFAHVLTPQLFWQAARLCHLPIIRSPLNLINLVWLAVAAARHPELSFAALLHRPQRALLDHHDHAQSTLDHRGKGPTPQHDHSSRHDPRQDAQTPLSAAAFAKARQRLPGAFWVALFLLLAEQFQRLYGDIVRWQRFRLLALDGTGLRLPDYPALRDHFGTPRNGTGQHGAQARLLLLQFPLARLPYAHIVAPFATGENSLARQLLHGLPPDALVLLDAGFLCYGLLRQVHDQGAFFCLRLRKRLNLQTVKDLSPDGSGNDVLVQWEPKDSRGQWRKEGLAKSMTLRLLSYHAKGFRPLRLLSNVLSPQEVAYAQFWGLGVSEAGEVLFKGLYNQRWEIEISYLELKVQQGLQGGVRSRNPEGVYYEVAGHILHYLLVRWLMVEAASLAQVSPLRLSFTQALREISGLWPAAVVASEAWLEQTLRPRLLERLASHQVKERPQRTYPRGPKARRAAKRAKDAKRAKAAKRAKGKADAAKKRPTPQWFGQGWDLAGPKVPLCPVA